MNFVRRKGIRNFAEKILGARARQAKETDDRLLCDPMTMPARQTVKPCERKKEILVKSPKNVSVNENERQKVPNNRKQKIKFNNDDTNALWGTHSIT